MFPAPDDPGPMVPVDMTPADPLPPTTRPIGRLSPTDLTFGPVGRVVATVVLLLPYALFLYSFVIYGMAGMVLWTPVFVRAMRDVWRRSDRLIDRRTASERGLHVQRPDDVPIVATEYPDDGDESVPPRRW